MKKELLYNSIDELLLWNYIQVRKTGNTKYLRRDWQTNDEPCAELWQIISDQYTQAISHRDSITTISDALRQILELTIDYNNIKAYCFILSMDFEHRVKTDLENYGYTVDTIDELNLIEGRAKALLTHIQVKRNELTALTEIKEEMNFESAIDRISDGKKYRLNSRDLTVSEWIAIEDNYINDIKKIQNERRNN